MARATAPQPPPVPPFWESRSFRWGILVAVALAVLVITGWLERVNSRYQVERRLREDPRFGPLLAQLSTAVDRGAAASDPALPKAVWLGRVDEVKDAVVSAIPDGHSPTRLFYLANPMLMLGSPGKNDRKDKGKTVPIAPRGYLFRDARPQTGETWLISVNRDESGLNTIHVAERYAP